MMPFNLTVFFTAMLIVRFYTRLTPRQIGQYGFVLCTVALLWLAFVVRNDWSAGPVLIGLVLFGIGQGSLVTLLFNVLVTYAPKQFAGDVGSLRGTIKNLAAGVGTAIAGALAVGILSVNIERSLVDNPAIPPDLIRQVDLDRATFVSNERLKDVMISTTATPEQISEAVRINAEARLRALKLSLLMLAAVALLVIVPVGRLPGYVRGKGPSAAQPRA